MKEYKKPGLALYLTVRCIQDDVERGMEFFSKHLNISKVYLETYRDGYFTEKERLLELKGFFEKMGIRTSGAITPTVMQSQKCDFTIEEPGVYGSGGTARGESQNTRKDERSTCQTLCYTREEHRAIIQKAAEYTAELFDEVILDDFFSTCCTCPECIKAKGEKTWQSFRLEQMAEVSKNLVVNPAKAVNHGVNMIIKYPNWYESYQEKGYNPKAQRDIFDEIYTGTETRDPNYSAQHLPRYGSYSLMRWMESVKRGCNGGGWIDPLDSLPNLGYYLEQAYLTFFAKGRELTLFCYSWLINTPFIPLLGFELQKLYKTLEVLGEPMGISVYEPFDASGEDHLYDYLGMLGLALEPECVFKNGSSMVMLTKNSAVDENILEKVKEHLLGGGDICITSGFLKAMVNRGIGEITTAWYTDKKITSDSFLLSGLHSFCDNCCIGRSLTVPAVDYTVSTAEAIVSLCTGDNNFPILLKNKYGNGNVYTLTIPDDFGEVYNFPPQVLGLIRQHLMKDLGVYFEGSEKIGIFLYNNNTFIIESFQNRSSSVIIHVNGKNRRLIDALSGETIKPITIREHESLFKIETAPVLYKVLKIEEM